MYKKEGESMAAGFAHPLLLHFVNSMWLISAAPWIKQGVQEIKRIFSSNICIAQGQVSVPAVVDSVSPVKRQIAESLKVNCWADKYLFL